MKKILLASTLLVGTAGVAAADISMSGSAGFGMLYNGATWAPSYYASIDFDMSGETDNGLMFGATVGFDANDTTVNDTAVWIEGGFGKLSVGDVDNANQAVVGGLSDVGYSGLGVDNVFDSYLMDDPVNNILYEGTFGDFSVALSADATGVTSDWAVAGGYSFGDYNVAIGADQAGGINAYYLGAGGTWGDFSANVRYSDVSGGGAAGYGLDASYVTGAVTITAAYATNPATDAYGLGVSYDLGGGATLDAGVASVGGTTVADFGINMSF